MRSLFAIIGAICLLSLWNQQAIAQAKIKTTGRIYKAPQSNVVANEEKDAPRPDVENSAHPEGHSQQGSGEIADDRQGQGHREIESSGAHAENKDINLVCGGAGSANKSDVINAYGSNNGSIIGSGGGFATYQGNSQATVVGTRSQAFQDQVAIEISPNSGRLRMPRVMLPIFRGGKNGWFKLTDIAYSPREITATISVNFMNRPKLRLDRYTGAVSISGKAGDYTGQCKSFDPDRTRRAF